MIFINLFICSAAKRYYHVSLDLTQIMQDQAGELAKKKNAINTALLINAALDRTMCIHSPHGRLCMGGITDFIYGYYVPQASASKISSEGPS